MGTDLSWGARTLIRILIFVGFYGRIEENSRMRGNDGMKRKSEITFLNLLLCLMVIFIHVSSESVSALDANGVPLHLISVLLWRLSLIVVPGFIALSGVKLFLKYKNTEFHALSFYKSRFVTILIPYLLWTTAYYVYYCIVKEDMSFTWGKLIFCLYSGEIGGHLYFVIALLQFYLLFPLFLFLFKRISPGVMLSVALLFQLILGDSLPFLVDFFVRDYYFIYADRIFTRYLFWWTAGCYIGLYYDQFCAALKKNTPALGAVFLAALGLELFSFVAKYRCAYRFPMEDTIHMLYTLTALLILYRIGFELRKTRWLNSKFVGLADRSSFYVYLSHCMLLMEVTRLLDARGITAPALRYGVKIGVVYFVSFALCMGYTACRTRLRERNKQK